ncbi:MAG: phenylalanine--tRNA ligase subunit beta [Sphingomonadaceae bacterium]|nr:phenylalanine--tRNA ligase subunit beta [Sphingomonadaceae bacterium]
MKFTLSWLRDHLDTDATLGQITDTLTAIGLEVDGVADPAERLKPFVIARVVSAEQHPNADKLRLCMVDVGAGEPVQVVCGAPNARAGMIAVFAPPGSYVPGTGITLKVAPVRGVESRGMLVSERELELSDEHTGIIELPADAGPVGSTYTAWAGLDDPVIDVAITPNRQDCMGVHGIARDLAAAGLGRLKPLGINPVPGAYPMAIRIATEDPEGCPVFLGRMVRGVRNGSSPAWLQRRLSAIGLRPISALVDVTNYVTVGWGRPLHVYDAAKIGGSLTARRARPGEAVFALNGRTYELDDSMTVIAAGDHADDIGGIMGGMETGVSAATTDVVVECAYFDPARTGATGRKLGITTDARARFERGVDPAFLRPGIELATRLIIELCGGEASEVAEAGAVPDHTRTVRYRPERARTLGGIEAAPAEQRAILERLGFGVVAGAAAPAAADPVSAVVSASADGAQPRSLGPGAIDAAEAPIASTSAASAGASGHTALTSSGIGTSCAAWEVSLPSWRRDVDGEADLVEEIVRIAGLDRVPATPLRRPPGVARPTASPAQLAERRARRAAAAAGLDEAVTWSFIAPGEAEPFGEAPWVLENPISADLAVMRTSLIPGLLAAARRNLARGAESVRLFEVGRRYLSDGERPTLAILLAGAFAPRDWRTGPRRAPTAYDVRALAETVLAAVNAPIERLQTLGDAPGWLHPGRSARLALNPKQPLGVLGELHPRLTRDLGGPVAVAELYLDALPPVRAVRARPPYAPPALQAVTRDFAFVVPETLSAEALVRAVRGADKAAITAARVFDRFASAGLGEGEVSLGIEVTLQPAERSFTEADLDAIAAKVVAAAGKLGARLRA